MKRRIIVATNNIKKIEEINDYFLKNNLNFYAEKTRLDLSKVNENGITFFENAKIKAEYVAKRIDYQEMVLSDDSGLCVNSLNGFPGIYSARWEVNQRSDYATKNKELLNMLYEYDDKSAYFECCLVLIDRKKNVFSFNGRVDGVLKENKNSPHYGFGYDHIFYFNQFNKFFSDMTTYEKNQISHRGTALEKLCAFLRH